MSKSISKNVVLKVIDSYFTGLSTVKFIIIMLALTYLTFILFFPIFYLYEEYIE